MNTHSERWQAKSATVGANLTRLRKANKMSMARLAGIVGISRSYLHALENGPKCTPSVFIAYDLAVALGTTIEELIGLPFDATSARGVTAKAKAAEAATLRRKLARIKVLCEEP